MILEGIVTSANSDGTTNIAPMGPIVDEAIKTLQLRPFQTSTTYRNLSATREGVFHVTDDVELLARTAIGRFDVQPELMHVESLACRRLADCCRWYAFQVESIDDREQRTEMRARVIDHGRVRDFLGFNRAKHAVLEAAILATRVQLLPQEHVFAELARLDVIVQKTAGSQETRAFALLVDHIRDAFQERAAG